MYQYRYLFNGLLIRWHKEDVDFILDTMYLI